MPLLYFKCPHCAGTFRRRVKKKLTGTAGCPDCKGQFDRAKCMLTDESEIKMARLKRAAAKKHQVAGTMNLVALRSSIGIRASQIPACAAEGRFKSKAATKGWTVHRPSWPDFLVETDQGLIAVEVKSKNDIVSKTQNRTFTILESMGVKVYLWHETEGQKDRLQRWKA